VTVLVAYATKHGATRQIAEAIGSRLAERGLSAVVRPVAEVEDIDGFEAVVVGSAVYLGSWMKDGRAFLDRHADALRRVPVWLFSSGPTGTDQGEALLQKRRERLDAVGARDHRVFGGALDPDDLGFLERRVVRTAKTPVGDFRDWPAIERWADEIANATTAGGD
jgi:menaquinone-dependent protoporphyrinogen oxidase